MVSAVKSSIETLALFGGTPLFGEPKHVGRPNLGDRDALMRRIGEMLDRRWFTNNGPLVQEFEERLVELTGAKHAVAMCNATVALDVAVRAIDLQGEVIVPSFTFVATPHALQWQGITPVFCDVDPATHNMDPGRVEALITPRTTGIIGVHVWGTPCDVEALSAIAARRGLHLMFDAAHALGCSHRGRPIGRFGEAEVFSFHATKFVNTFEGGAATTDDDRLAKRMRDMRNFGFSGYDRVDYLGINGKMPEVSAAMGLTSLESKDAIIAVNLANYRAYTSGLSEIPGLTLLTHDESESHNFQYIIVEVDAEITGITRDLLIRLLHAENVLARRYFYPGCHQMEPYRSYFPHAGLLLPETEKLTQRVLSLPNGTAVTPEAVTQICRLIRFLVENGESISTEARQREA